MKVCRSAGISEHTGKVLIVSFADTDVVVAMDLASLALCVVCAQESTIRLGDLVVDNMLYQVFKAYAQLKQVVNCGSLHGIHEWLY